MVPTWSLSLHDLKEPGMNKIKILITLFILATLLIIAGAALGQQTNIYTDKDLDYKKALELYNKQKYAIAQEFFQKAIEKNNGIHSEIRTNSEYYAALCAVELFHKDAEELLTNFIYNHPESHKINFAYFQLGNYNYRNKKYKDAINWYEKVEIYDLTTEELAEYYFKTGYSYFDELRLEEAGKMFFEIKDVDTKYTAPANYYYSHIAYQNKNYETALTGFRKLENDLNFGPIVPYYIAQIYFLQNHFDKVIEYAPALLDSSNTKRAPEIARLIGESYFKTLKFGEAVPYLEKYKKAVGRISREDAYQLGYAYYKSSEPEKAVEYFKEVANEQDTLTQNAYYHLADCYLKLNNKNFALNAFLSASKLDMDKEIKEDAHFNYAKLSYELSYNPYYEAIAAFQTYIKEFPDSERKDEAYKYLLNVFLTTKNYKEALIALESINNKTKDLEYAFQKVAYYRGVELFNAGNYGLSITHFDKALNLPFDKNITAQSYYWKAEAYFNQKNYDKAIEGYKTFLFEPGAAAQNEYFTTNYNLGYAYYKKKDYPEAISWFRKYASIKPIEDDKKLNDALLRTADSYFISKDYSNASDYYGQAAEIQVINTDYALFQKAVCFGLTGKNEAKLPVLESIIKNYPNSQYADDAKFETGKTYLAIGDNPNALKYFKQVGDEHPNSSYVKKAMVKQGIIYFNQDENEAALAVYKRVIEDYPSTPESFEALSGIKSIYVEKGNADEYSSYLESLPFPNVSSASLDSTFYETAENIYMKGDCENAVKSFSNYLNKYADGIFAVNVNFYQAECHVKLQQYEQALTGYNFVISKPKNIFTEKSLAKSASIYFNKKNYTEAQIHYTRLEELAEMPGNMLDARTGLMRSNYLANKLEAAVVYAEKLFHMENVPSGVINEANLIMGKSALQNNQLEVALSKFQLTAENARNETGAEGKYNEAYVKYLQQKYKESEKTIFELANGFSSYDFWVAKSFILLSDNYIALNDNFQAKHTLQSIIDNYEGDDLKAIAIEKLNKIIAAEKPQEQLNSPEPVEIKFNESGTNDDKLFEGENNNSGGSEDE